MCPGPETRIECAAKTAKNLLGQLGPLAWALHSHRVQVGPTAILLSVDPETFVQIGVRDPCGSIRSRVVEDLECLRRGVSLEEAPRLFNSEGLRDAVNRSIVVYAVAVLEQFLDDAGREAYKRRDGDESKWPASFGGMVARLRGKDVRLCKCDHYPQAGLLALYRHKIVHVDAKVDEKLVCQVACLEKATGRQLQFCLSDDESSVVWVPCGGEKLCDAWTRKKISLAIDEVVLPLLRDTQAFVAEAACKMAE